MTKPSKCISLVIVAGVYIAAFFSGLVVYGLAMRFFDPLAAFFAADAAATAVVFIFGLIFSNASVYDPYWSVAALVLVAAFAVYANSFRVISVFYIIAFAFWGIRLTVNWAINWTDLSTQDWRYTMLKRKNPRLWLVTDFFGINLMPTAIVFAGLIPAYFAICAGGEANAVSAAGLAVALSAAVVQLISDAQMLRFRRDAANRGKAIQSGLWRYSRHPNYFGEVSFWWGVWMMQAGALPHIWWTVFAPLIMTSLFVFISIPMMEKKLLETKECYGEYKKATSMLIPLPRRRVS